MNIRKHWKKILLSSTAFFWASCGADSESTPVASGANNEEPVTPDSIVNPNDLDGITIDTLYGIKPVYDADSGAVSSSDACDGNCATSSSSEDTPLSSSTVSGNDEAATYKLASNPDATCKMVAMNPTGSCIELSKTPSSESPKPSAKDLINQLRNNKTKTLEELEAIEDQLEDTPDFSEVALYGVQMPTCFRYNYMQTFECSNDSTYFTYEDKSGKHVLKDSTIYTREEFDQKFSSSSQAEESSSSAEPASSSSVQTPSPLCTKNDFVDSFELQEQFSTDKGAQIDSAKKAVESMELDSLNKAKANSCLSSAVINESEIEFRGSIAKEQTCDGETIVNPRYQAKLDSNRAFIQEQIDNCLKKPE